MIGVLIIGAMAVIPTKNTLPLGKAPLAKIFFFLWNIHFMDSMRRKLLKKPTFSKVIYDGYSC